MPNRKPKLRLIDPETVTGKLIREFSRNCGRWIDLYTRGRKQRYGELALLKLFVEELKLVNTELEGGKFEKKRQLHRLRVLRNAARSSLSRLGVITEGGHSDPQISHALQVACSDVVQFSLESAIMAGRSQWRLRMPVELLVGWIGNLIPRRKREAIMGDLLEDIAERRSQGWNEFSLFCFTAWQLLLIIWQTLPPALRRLLLNWAFHKLTR
jgi:hypothetical protein